jgi:hypothetical protein
MHAIEYALACTYMLPALMAHPGRCKRHWNGCLAGAILDVKGEAASDSLVARAGRAGNPRGKSLADL